MTQADFKQFQAIIRQSAAVTVVRSSVDLGTTAVAMFEMLKNKPYTLAEISQAFTNLAETNTYFPSLENVLTELDKIAHGGLSQQERVAYAWSVVVQTARSHPRDSVRFPTPAFHYAILQDPEGGSWDRFCNQLNDENLPFRAKDFAVYYTIGEKKATFAPDGDPLFRVPEYLQSNEERRYLHDVKYYPDIPQPKIFDVATGQSKLFSLPEPEIKAIKARNEQLKAEGATYAPMIRALIAQLTGKPNPLTAKQEPEPEPEQEISGGDTNAG